VVGRGVKKPRPGDLVRVAIIGVVDVIDIVDHHRSKWFRGPFGWLLRNSRPLLKPISCTGRLGLWRISQSDEDAIRRQLGRR